MVGHRPQLAQRVAPAGPEPGQGRAARAAARPSGRPTAGRAGSTPPAGRRCGRSRPGPRPSRPPGCPGAPTWRTGEGVLRAAGQVDDVGPARDGQDRCLVDRLGPLAPAGRVGPDADPLGCRVARRSASTARSTSASASAPTSPPMPQAGGKHCSQPPTPERSRDGRRAAARTGRPSSRDVEPAGVGVAAVGAEGVDPLRCVLGQGRRVAGQDGAPLLARRRADDAIIVGRHQPGRHRRLGQPAGLPPDRGRAASPAARPSGRPVPVSTRSRSAVSKSAVTVTRAMRVPVVVGVAEGVADRGGASGSRRRRRAPWWPGCGSRAGRRSCRPVRPSTCSSTSLLSRISSYGGTASGRQSRCGWVMLWAPISQPSAARSRELARASASAARAPAEASQLAARRRGRRP